MISVTVCVYNILNIHIFGFYSKPNLCIIRMLYRQTVMEIICLEIGIWFRFLILYLYVISMCFCTGANWDTKNVTPWYKTDPPPVRPCYRLNSVSTRLFGPAWFGKLAGVCMMAIWSKTGNLCWRRNIWCPAREIFAWAVNFIWGEESNLCIMILDGKDIPDR